VLFERLKLCWGQQDDITGHFFKGEEFWIEILKGNAEKISPEEIASDKE
jgi:hypothetical protein